MFAPLAAVEWQQLFGREEESLTSEWFPAQPYPQGGIPEIKWVAASLLHIGAVIRVALI